MREHSQSVFIIEGLQPSWLGLKAKWFGYGAIVAWSVALSFALLPGAIGWYAAGLKGALSCGSIIGVGILLGVGLGCWSESRSQNGVMSGSIAGMSAWMVAGIIAWQIIDSDPLGISESSASGIIFGFFIGAIAGLIVGAIGGVTGALGVSSLNNINLVEITNWKWSRFWNGAVLGSIVGGLMGATLGLVIGLIVGRASGPRDGLLTGLFVALAFALVSGMVGGLAGGSTDQIKMDRVSPNEGIRLSSISFLVPFLVTGLTSGTIVGLFVGLSNGLPAGAVVGIIVGIVFGIVFGLIVGLNRGGAALIKHYALRLTLWLSGYTPLNFIKFLDHCAKLIFLKKVGGGYIFIHRMLLDYFADLPAQSAKR